MKNDYTIDKNVKCSVCGDIIKTYISSPERTKEAGFVVVCDDCLLISPHKEFCGNQHDDYSYRIQAREFLINRAGIERRRKRNYKQR